MWPFIVVLMTPSCMVMAVPLPQSIPNIYSNPGIGSFGMLASADLGTDAHFQTTSAEFNPTMELKPAGDPSSPGLNPLGSIPLGSAPFGSAYTETASVET